MSPPDLLAAARSLLFVPASDADRAERAFGRGADAVILDLEDGVAPAAKADARRVALELTAVHPDAVVRVNGMDTPWGDDDLRAIMQTRPAAIALPKAAPAALDAWSVLERPLLAIVETADGLRQAFETASHPHVAALMLGAADLGAELRLRPRADGLELLHARSSVVVASAAAGVRAPFDAVHLEIGALGQLEREAVLARSLGFGGKACVHPAQIESVNLAFSPSAEELADAREIVAAYELARDRGRGAVTVRGRLVDRPVVAQAQATLTAREEIP